MQHSLKAFVKEIEELGGGDALPDPEVCRALLAKHYLALKQTASQIPDYDPEGYKKPSRTMEQLASEALLVQDASNLSGVVHGFSRSITDLWKHANQQKGLGTDWVNRHPICKLWADKIAHLAGTQNADLYSLMAAYEAVENLKGDINEDHRFDTRS